MQQVVVVLLAVALGAVHLFAGKLRFLDIIPRSRWLSLASGISLAYVFVHVMPELAIGQQHLAAAAGHWLVHLEHHVYLIGLAGLIVFYGLERLAKTSRAINRGNSGRDVTTASVFWLHIGSYALYNMLVAYLLFHREQPGYKSLLFFFLAMLTHFFVNDYGLREHHKHAYHAYGRWTLLMGTLLGTATGLTTAVTGPATAALFAFLAGGVILNVLKEELPAERQSRFLPFLAGATGYTVLLLLG